MSGVQGEARQVLVLAFSIAQGWYQWWRWPCLGLPWWGQPRAFPPPLSGGPWRAGHIQHRACGAIRLSMGADYPLSRLGGREGHALCLDQLHASSYMGVCKIRVHKTSPSPFSESYTHIFLMDDSLIKQNVSPARVFLCYVLETAEQLH